MEDISKQNAEKLGTQTILWQTQEECAELIKAISKYNRARGFGQKTEVTVSEAYNNLAEELADVSICIEQLAYMLHAEEAVERNRQKAFSNVNNRYLK